MTGHWGSCRPSEVNSASVIQKTATRRSKQTAQHKQHPINTNRAPLTGSHQQGGSESAEPSWALTGGWGPAGFQKKMLYRLETTYSHPKSFFLSLYVCNSHLHGPRMPYSLKDPGIFTSSNLRAAPCTCCHREKKMETGWRVWESWKLYLICFNLAFSELLCQSGGKPTLEV